MLEKYFTYEFSRPTYMLLVVISILCMIVGIPFWATFLIVTIATAGAIKIFKAHKLDLVYIILAYIVMLGYLFPNLLNLGS